MGKQKEYPRMKELREFEGLSQRQVAEYLNLYTTQYQRYEWAESTIPADIIVALAMLYNVSTDYILGLSDEKKSCASVKNNVNISGGNNKLRFK